MRPQFAELAQRGPVEGRVQAAAHGVGLGFQIAGVLGDEVRQLRLAVEQVVHGPAGMGDTVPDYRGAHVHGDLEVVADVPLAQAVDRHVDGQYQGGVTSFEGAADQPFGLLAAADVQLEPLVTASPGGHFLDRVAGRGGQGKGDVGLFRGTGQGQVRVRPRVCKNTFRMVDA